MIHLVFGEKQKQKRDTARRESIEEIANVDGAAEKNPKRVIDLRR